MYQLRAIRIDVRLTDEHILNVIKEKLGTQPGELTLQQIAAQAKCSKDTVFNAIRRLEYAQRLTSTWQGQSKPCIYQVLEETPPPP